MSRILFTVFTTILLAVAAQDDLQRALDRLDEYHESKYEEKYYWKEIFISKNGIERIYEFRRSYSNNDVAHSESTREYCSPDRELSRIVCTTVICNFQDYEKLEKSEQAALLRQQDIYFDGDPELLPYIDDRQGSRSVGEPHPIHAEPSEELMKFELPDEEKLSNVRILKPSKSAEDAVFLGLFLFFGSVLMLVFYLFNEGDHFEQVFPDRTGLVAHENGTISEHKTTGPQESEKPAQDKAVDYPSEDDTQVETESEEESDTGESSASDSFELIDQGDF